MKQERKNTEQAQKTLKTLLAAELFSKLSDSQQDEIIRQLKAHLSHS